MATIILIDPTIDRLPLGNSIVDILRLKGEAMSAEKIQEALKTIDISGGEYYIDASTEEIQEILDTWLVPDNDVIQVDENLFQVPVPCPV